MLVAGVERETNSLATLVRANPLRSGLGFPARPRVITRNLNIWTSSLEAAAPAARANVRYPSFVRSESFTSESIEIAMTTAEVRSSPRATHFITDFGS
jgi:hypothetical protein